VSAIIRSGSWHGEEFVLVCDYHPKTNGLGKVQRAIVDFLATGPGGFGHCGDGYHGGRSSYHHRASNEHRAANGYPPELDLLWHGLPHGVQVAKITAAVYATQEPTASQTRVVHADSLRDRRPGAG
jgi:hypothetical protein